MDGGISSRATNKLTDRGIDAFIKKARGGRAATRKLSDGGGMFLTLTPAGTPVWRIKYRLAGRERLFAIGVYPEVGLERARAARETVKTALREGRDPVQARQVHRAATTAASDNTFQAVAEDWLAKRQHFWSKIHHTKSKHALERDVYPRLGKLPVTEISPAMVAGTIEAIAQRGARETAGRILQHVSGVFRLAQARGLCRDNPASPVREVIPKRINGRLPAILNFPELGDVLRRAEAARLSPAVRMAHRLCAFTAARIGNIIQAEWPEFDLEADVPTWIIPRRKMKARDRHHDHKIILGKSIAAELRQWRNVFGDNGYVFPSPTGGKHISRESIEKTYRETLKLKDKHSPHGWRAALSTLSRDEGFERDVVELALDHVHDNDVVRAYDRGERLSKRIALARWWTEQLAQAQRESKAIPGRAA